MWCFANAVFTYAVAGIEASVVFHWQFCEQLMREKKVITESQE